MRMEGRMAVEGKPGFLLGTRRMKLAAGWQVGLGLRGEASGLLPLGLEFRLGLGVVTGNARNPERG